MIFLLVNSFIIGPLVQWLVSSNRGWSKTTGFFLAATLMATAAVVEVQRYDLNHYEILELPKSATRSEITKAYRKASLTFHPDKSDKPEDAAHFLKIQAAYEALSDDGKRSHYEAYGPNEAGADPVDSTTRLLTILVTYFAKLLLAGFLTGGPELAMARWWLFNFLLASLAAEILMTRMGVKDLFSFLPFLGNWPIFQQILLLGSLFPVMMTSCMVLSRETFADVDTGLLASVTGVVESTVDVIKTLRGTLKEDEIASAEVKITEAYRRPAMQKTTFLSTVLPWLFWVFIGKNGYNLAMKNWQSS